MTEDVIRSFGYLTLGSRMKRIGETLQSESQRIVDQFSLSIQSSQYPLLATLDREGSMAIGELASAVGVSQPGVTRTVAALVKQGLLESTYAADDQRRRVVALTEEGRRLVDFSKRNVWPRIEAAVQDVCLRLSGTLLDQLAGLEDGLSTVPLEGRPEPAGQDSGDAHVLDRPFWSALTSKQGKLSIGGSLARRYETGLIPFIAIGASAPANLEALPRLMSPGEALYLVQSEPLPALPGIDRIGEARVVQMVCEQTILPESTEGIERLTEADADEMLALATLTKPGPFCRRAGELGEFWGVKIDGRLAGMAGTRMVLDGYTELSGVCTHPDFQGRGLARRLSVFVARRFQERGEIPFLHAFDTNERAIGLYESIGFRIRTKLNVAILKRS